MYECHIDCQTNKKTKKGNEKMNDNFDKVMFYYLRDNNKNPNDKSGGRGVPFGVVAVRENPNGTVNRGVSICSPSDRYNKKAGRGIAFKRLLKAETDCRSTPFAKYNGVDEKKKITNLPFAYKSDFNAEITEGEHRMFHKPEGV